MKVSRKCSGISAKGTPCGANAIKGTARCRHHPADSSDVRTPARDERWDRQQFLDCFAWCGMVTTAAELIGVSRSTVYLERQRNEDFALAWADMEERSTEQMEREAFRRAVEGVEKPLVSAGKHVTNVREYSDGLLQFMLKARRPDRYRERVDVKHAGEITKRVRVDLSKLDTDDLDALERMAAKLEA